MCRTPKILLLAILLGISACNLEQITSSGRLDRPGQNPVPVSDETIEDAIGTDIEVIEAPNPNLITILFLDRNRFLVKGVAGAAQPNADISVLVEEGKFEGLEFETTSTKDGAFQVAITAEFNTLVTISQIFTGGSGSTQKFTEGPSTSAGRASRIASIGNFTGSGGVEYAILDDDKNQVEIYSYEHSAGELFSLIKVLPERQFGSDWGKALLSVGDLNEDGYEDLAVSSPTFNTFSNYLGAIFIFAGGPCAAPDECGPLLMRIDGYSRVGDFGQKLAYSKSFYKKQTPNGVEDRPVLFVSESEIADDGRVKFFDLKHCLELTDPTTRVSSCSTMRPLVGENTTLFGYALENIGDFNGDGFEDLAVSAIDQTVPDNGLIPVSAVDGSSESDASDIYGIYIGGDADTSDPSLFLPGKVFVFLGGDCSALGGCGGLHTTIQDSEFGPDVGNLFGQTLAAAGDVDGDGFSDFFIGTPSQSVELNGNLRPEPYVGRVYCIGGKRAGKKVLFKKDGQNTKALFGTDIVRVGDYNGDGREDFALSSPYYLTPSNRRYGRIDIFSFEVIDNIPQASQIGYIVGRQENSRFGYKLVAPGDIDADGLSDLFVLAPYYNDGSSTIGMTYLFYGFRFDGKATDVQ